jgi:RNA polymerase sigma-70 factor (ECF subfamily)
VEATGGAPTATRETRALPANNDTARTATADRVPDPGSLELDAIWEGEWRENLLRTALERMKQSVNPAHYEMYHLHVVQGLTPRETARALGVSRAAVYLAKHRVGRLLKKEIQRLENETR